MSEARHETVSLRRGGKVTIPRLSKGHPILVFVGEKGARYRFRGVVHNPVPSKCVTYAKLNFADETLEVLAGDVEVQYVPQG